MMAHPLTLDRATLVALGNEARLIDNPPGQIPPGALAGERTSRQQGRGLNFDSLRRYQPGDDVRLIDWQATARLRTPWIRLYNEERERPVFLIVDQRLDMFFATRGGRHLCRDSEVSSKITLPTRSPSCQLRQASSAAVLATREIGRAHV